jgi:hypothetical protein
MNTNNVYDLLTYYFDNPKFTKIKDENMFSIYMCKTGSLANMSRYLVAMVQLDVYFIGRECTLDQLRWQVFQTRSIPIDHHLKIYYYRPKQDKMSNSIIKICKRDEKICEYTCDTLPIKITLLNDDNDMYTYPDIGSVNSALETYNTIITMNLF